MFSEYTFNKQEQLWSHQSSTDDEGNISHCTSIKRDRRTGELEHTDFSISEFEKQGSIALSNLQSITKEKIISLCYTAMWDHYDIQKWVFPQLSGGNYFIDTAFDDILSFQKLGKKYWKDKEEMIGLLQKMMLVGKWSLESIESSLLKDWEENNYENIIKRMNQVCKEKRDKMLKSAELLEEWRKTPIFSCPFPFTKEYKEWLSTVWDILENKYVPAIEEFEEDYEQSNFSRPMIEYNNKVRNIVSNGDSIFFLLLYILFYSRK